MKTEVPFANAYWVVPGWLLAGEHPAELDADAAVERLTALLEAGIRTFLDLTEERDGMPDYSRFLRLAASKRQIETATIRISIRDQGIPSVATMRQILDAIDGSIGNGRPMFIHCFAGIGRTGTVVGCYLLRHGLATVEDVIAKIADLRKLMPNGDAPSPQTEEQVRFVKSWEKGW